MMTASELSARLADLLRDERHALAEFLVALGAGAPAALGRGPARGGDSAGRPP